MTAVTGLAEQAPRRMTISGNDWRYLQKNMELLKNKI
jgi:hypothetical protein